MNDVIFIDGDFAIIRTEAIFCIGFNCYKATKPGGSDFVKINDIASWFKTEDAARKWLADFMANVMYTPSGVHTETRQVIRHKYFAVVSFV